MHMGKMGSTDLIRSRKRTRDTRSTGYTEQIITTKYVDTLADMPVLSMLEEGKVDK